jgi:hypothetical protein
MSGSHEDTLTARDGGPGAAFRHVWVETLTARAALWASISTLWRPTAVYCTELTPSGRAVLLFAKRMLGNRLTSELRELDMAVTDETGHALYRRHELMLARLARSIIPDDPNYRWLPAPARANGDLWCRVLASNFHDRWHPVIAFLVWVENLYKTGVMAVPAGKVEVLIPDGWVARHLAQEFSHESTGLVTVKVLTSPVAWFLYYPLPLFPVIAGIRLALVANRRPPKAKVDLGAIAEGTFLAQYHFGALDTHLARANLLWHASSGIANRRVIVLINRPEDPMTNDVRRRLDDTGFGWVEDMAQVYSADRPFRTVAQELCSQLTALPRRWSSLAVSRWVIAAYIGLRVAGCRKFFRQYNIRACALSWNFFTETGIVALAAQYEGAIYLRWNKSMHGPFQNIFHRSMAHIAFVWGNYDRAFLRAHDFRCPLFLTSGVVAGDEVDEAMQRDVLALRNSMAPQVRFVIGLFDTSFNRKLYCSEDHIVEYYRNMLAAVRDRPHWGCMIKTKMSIYDQLPKSDGVQDLVAELEKDKRCVILDGHLPASSLILAVDAVVCCTINMAGHLVAISGVPALHLDYSGQYMINWYDHPAAAKCFFTDAGAVVHALEEIERGDRSWGDASSWRDLLDHFQDGRGSRRVGEAIRFYMDRISTGTDVKTALDKLGDWYADRYGAETVRRLGDGLRDEVDAWFAKSNDKFYASRPRPFPNAPQ